MAMSHASDTLLSGQLVLHTLISDFIGHVDRKVEQLLNNQLGGGSYLTKDTCAKLLQRGEDHHFDQLLWSLGCMAEYCLPCLVETMFNWYNHQIPNKQRACIEKSQKGEQKSKSDGREFGDAKKGDFREFVVEFVFCLALIEILKQIPVHPLPDKQVHNILAKAFNNFHCSAQPNDDNDESRIISDLYGEMIGVLAQSKFVAVQNKFMHELLKNKEPTGTANTLIALIKGMKYFRVKMYPVEDFETSFRFMQELATYNLDLKNREVKNALAGFFVEVLVPVAAAVKTEVNVPVLRDFVDSLYPTSLELSKRAKNKPAIFPLVTCLLCVSQKTFFLNNWHIFLDICLSTLKSRDPRLSRVALESLYRLLWVYMVRIKCESNTTTQARLQLIVKSLFPVGSRNVVPKDMPLNIFVKIIQFIALERIDFAMRDIVLDLLATPSLRFVKPVTLYPERMNIALRAFLVITDSLQQKDGTPPMPSTMNVMPSGNTIRVKKTFLNKTLTEEDARSIGVLQYLKHVQRSLGGILSSLDSQVGQKLLQTNSHISAKSTKELVTAEQKPKIELFRTCIAVMPRLMPHGLSHGDLLNMLCRLTVHIDDDLRNRAIIALQAFIIDFPALSEEVVASFLSFVQNQITDIHFELVHSSLKIAASLLSTWKTSILGKESRTLQTQSPSSLQKKSGNEIPADLLGSVSMPTSQSCCAFAPIISRVEGFAMVYLCHTSNLCRKLAFNVLKETRSLANILASGKSHDQLCLDCLDQFCYEVSIKIMREESYFQKMKSLEIEVILSAGYERNIASLIELSSCWPEADGYHPWMFFMIEFINSLQISGMCSNTLSYCWSDMFIRASQLQHYIEPFMTTGTKKAAFAAAVNDEHTLMLFTHYLMFLGRSSLSSISVKHWQDIESAVPAGTPDWRVRLLRDRKRLDAVPSTLFRKMVEVLKSENLLPAFKENVVLGLGYTSVVAFQDLLVELQHVLHEANESKKQENVRRRRKRGNMRTFLLKLFTNLAIHKVLSKGIYKQVEKLGGGKKIPREIIEEYIDDTLPYIELLDKSETTMITSFSSQHLNGPLSSTSQMFYQNTAAMKEDMRLKFSNLIIHLIRHYPISSRPNLLKPVIKRKLFHLFGSWYEKSTKDAEKSSNISSQVYIQNMLYAQCSVMCCGPIFDDAGLKENGYLYEFLELLLSSSNEFVQHLGQESIVLLLHFNSKILHCQTWVVDKCYTSHDIISRACFLAISFIYRYTGLCRCIITILSLTLFKTTDPDIEVSQEAEHLMNVLLEKYLPRNVSGCTFDISQNQRVEKSTALSSLHQRLRVTEELVQHYPELTYYILSEIFRRFRGAKSEGQRRLLEIVRLWLSNVQLIPSDCNAEEIRDSEIINPQGPPENGWGSEEGTIFILNNILYLTVFYRYAFETEVHMCWSVLCSTWPSNLSACLQYFSALYSVKSNESLRAAIRHAVECVTRKLRSKILSVLLKQCLQPHLVSITVESQIGQPFYQIVLQNACLRAESSPSTSITDLTAEKEMTAGSLRKKPFSYDEDISKDEATGTSNNSASPRPFLGRKYPSHYRLSLQIPLQGDSRLSHDQQTGHFNSKDPNKSFHNPFKGTAKLSSSMMSLSKTGPSTLLSDDSEILRFNTLSSRQPNKHSGLVSFAEEHSTVQEMEENSLRTSPELSASCSAQPDPALSELGKLIAWRANEDSCSRPKPLPLSSPYYLPLYKLICCDRVVGLTCSGMSCIFLSQIVISQCFDIDWRIHLPVVTLALLMNVDQMGLKEVPFYCRKMLAHIVLKIGGRSIPKYLVSSMLSYTPASCRNVPGLHSSFKLLHSQSDEHNLGDVNNPGSNVDELLQESIKKLLTELVSDSGELWACEDISPKMNTLRSFNKLSAFVQCLTNIVESFMPDVQFKKKLAGEAIKFAVTTSFSHYASRSLQIFRALRMTIGSSMLNRLVHCLLNRIAYGTDVQMQSHVIEILLTLLQDCEFGFKCYENFSPEDAKKILAEVVSYPERQQSPSWMQPRSGSTVDISSTHSPKASSYLSKPSEMPSKKGKIHAHRRSGSVTLSKKMTVQLLNSVVGPIGQNEASPSGTMLYPNTDPSKSDAGMLSHQKHATAKHGDSSVVKTTSPSNPPNSVAYDNRTVLINERNCLSFEKHATSVQIFWLSIALLESDYEHEFLLALQLMEKVLANLPLVNSANEIHIERQFAHIKWKPFPGIQSLLLKGLTSSMTSDLTFHLLSSFTKYSHTHLVSGDYGERYGFALNVVSQLPRMLDCFDDPDAQCLTAAKRIAAVCTERYLQEKKLQHLAHVMLLYADHTYEQSSSIWISVVAKYLHETFPEVIREQIEFFSLMLERGPTMMHFSCIRILHSLLFQSQLLHSNKQSDVVFLHHMIKTVSKLINNPKLWKDALMILKLAVSRSSAIATPSISGSVLQSASFTSDGDRITLPGRTLTFKYNISGAPLIGRQPTEEVCDKRRLNTGSPTGHPRSSFAAGSWKKPILSQKRTYERISHVVQICGRGLIIEGDREIPHEDSEKSDTVRDENSGKQVESDSDDAEIIDGTVFDDEKGHDVANEGGEMEDIVVLRNFDFLDEFDENDEGFTTGYQKSNHVNSDEVNNIEDDPDTCNLTPFLLPDITHDLHHVPSEENSDFSDVSEQDFASQTSGIVSQSMQENKSLLIETGCKQLSSLPVTTPSTDKTDLTCYSSCESIEISESPGKCDLSSRFTVCEKSLDCPGMLSQDSLKNCKENMFSESAASDSPTTSIETDDEDVGETAAKLQEVWMQCHNDIPESSKNTAQGPPAISLSESQCRYLETAATCKIPVIDPPPVTSDITSNLSAVPFGLSTQSIPVVVATKHKQNNDIEADTFVPYSTHYKDDVYKSWKLHIASLTSSNDLFFVSETFDLFPKLFEILCEDFCGLSKKGCMYLGGQLSKIAEHFSSMVEQLPSQIKCPQCFASQHVLHPIVDKTTYSIHKLHEHLEAYHTKREYAEQCIKSIREIEIGSDRETFFTTRYRGMGHDQLKLCRILYQLHYQLLLLLTSFNELIKFCVSENITNVTKQLEELRKRILTIEKTYHTHPDKQDIDMMKNLKSLSIREAKEVLASSISNEHYHLAIRQLHILRQLWPGTFGRVYDPAGDFLAKVLFKHLESQSNEEIFAIIGSEEASNEVCGKLMKVNEQIQSSLQSLALNADDTVKTSTIPVLKKTHF